MRSHHIETVRPVKGECALVAGSETEKMLLARVEQLERQLKDALEWLKELSDDMLDQVISVER